MIATEIIHYGMVVPPRSTPRPEDASSAGQTASSGARILIVEDDYLIGMIIEETLLEAGHEILGLVTTGEAAVRQGPLLKPDLVLMDIRLAGPMSGIEAALKLREMGIPSLFTSAHSDPGIRAQGEAAQPAGWLPKPFSSSDMVSAVDAALAGLKRH